MSDEYTIDIKDVLVGDTILAAWSEDGIYKTRKGVVASVTDGFFRNESGAPINMHTGQNETTLYLIDRAPFIPDGASFKWEIAGEKTVYYRLTGERVEVWHGRWTLSGINLKVLVKRIKSGDIIPV